MLTERKGEDLTSCLSIRGKEEDVVGVVTGLEARTFELTAEGGQTSDVRTTD